MDETGSGHGRITDWPESERPRERLLRLGAGALGDGELLALLLRTGRAGETALDVGRRVIAAAGPLGIAGLADLAQDELVVTAGVGPAKAAVILAALELGRRVVAAPPRVVRYRTSEDVAGPLIAEMGPLDREQFRVVLLDTKCGLISCEVIATGGLDHVPVEPREVFKPAIRRSAAAVVLAHNHPSGDPEPSSVDVALTERLVRAGRLLGVRVLDHLVIGRQRYASLASTGRVAFDS